jgi:hypothetical protein
MKRLIDFFLEEQRLRWKVYLASACIAFVYGSVNLFAFHRTEERVSLETVVALFTLVTIFVAVYVAKGAAPFGESKEPRRVIQLDWKLAVAGTAGLVLLASAYLTGISGIQAAIVDFRLKSFAQTVQAANLSDQQLFGRYKKIQSMVAVSSANQIPVDPGLLDKVQTAVSSSLKERSPSDQTKQLGWSTSIDLETFAYSRRVQTGQITPISTRQIANAGGMMLASPVSLNNVNTYIRGEHSWFALAPSGGRFVLNQSSVVFDSIDFLGSFSGPAIELVGDRSNAVVRDSILKFVDQSLDGVTWVDDRFENSHIRYTEGSPLRLRNVSFKDCELSHTSIQSGPVSRELEKRVTEAGDRPITFVYESQPR